MDIILLKFIQPLINIYQSITGNIERIELHTYFYNHQNILKIQVLLKGKKPVNLIELGFLNKKKTTLVAVT